MQDAVTALRSAIGELEDAQRALPDDLSREVSGVIEQARSVLQALETPDRENHVRDSADA